MDFGLDIITLLGYYVGMLIVFYIVLVGIGIFIYKDTQSKTKANIAIIIISIPIIILYNILGLLACVAAILSYSLIVKRLFPIDEKKSQEDSLLPNEDLPLADASSQSNFSLKSINTPEKEGSSRAIVIGAKVFGYIITGAIFLLLLLMLFSAIMGP